MAAALLAVALPAALRADISATVTLQSGSRFSFDTGTTVTSGGDILFNGTSITPQGSAGIFNLTSAAFSSYSTLTQAGLAAFGSAYGSTAISGSSLGVNDVFAVHTVGGNYAKVLVTGGGSSSITLQYTTFGATASGGGGGGGGGPTGPTITDVENNSSLIPAGFPNSGISPSMLIVIHGSNLADAGTPQVLYDVTHSPLPTTLNGATVTVVAGGTSYPLPIYYTSTTQIDAVLPGNVPPGAAMLTVNYRGSSSAGASIRVLPNAFGIDTYNSGTAVVTDAITGALLTPTASGKPGEIVVLWGTGLGASNDSDSSYTSSPHQKNANAQLYIGGVQVPGPLPYAGASVYPGVDVIQFTIPQSVGTGCFVPIAVVTGNVVSNVATVAVSPNGGVCSEPEYGITGTQISNLGQQTTVRTGVLFVAQATSPGQTGAPQTFDSASASFSKTTSTSSGSGGGGTVSLGGCTLNETVTGGGSSTSVGLDAGTVTVTPPSGSAITMSSFGSGIYAAQIGSIPTSGGTFAFNATGGADVGKFSANVNFPNPLLSWTNQSAAATVTRASGLQVTWSGGAANSFVIITGSASGSGVSGSYTCLAPVAPDAFTVPAFILLGLPAGSGTTAVSNYSNYSTFTASGLDTGIAIGAVSTSVKSTYQ